MQPISQWTSTNVVEWMAALNLYRYVELFRSKDIKGVDLLSLDKDKLMVTYSTLHLNVSRTHLSLNVSFRVVPCRVVSCLVPLARRRVAYP